MTCGIWQVTYDRWHMTCDMWHVTWDTWHVIHETLCGLNILSKCQLFSSNSWRVMMFLIRFGRKECWLIQLITKLFVKYPRLHWVCWSQSKQKVVEICETGRNRKSGTKDEIIEQDISIFKNKEQRNRKELVSCILCEVFFLGFFLHLQIYYDFGF